MTKSKLKSAKKWGYAWLAIVVFLSACTIPSSSVQLHAKSVTDIRATQKYVDAFGNTAADIELLKQRIKAKASNNQYNLALSINPDLLIPKSRPTLSAVFKPGFSVKGSHQAVWQDQLGFVGNNDSENFTLTLPSDLQTNQRYRLELKSSALAEVQVLRKGILIAQKTDLSYSGFVIEKLVVDAGDTLSVRVKSQGAGQIDLALFTQGQAGHIFKQATRPLQILDPQDQLLDLSEIAALSQLKNHDGELVVNDKLKLTGMLVNSTDQLSFQSGALILRTDSQQALQAFQSRYGAQVLEQSGNRYLMKVDLTSISLDRVPDLFRQYNLGAAENIEGASFASVSGMQTFAILLDSVQQIPNWESFSVELNGVPEVQQATPTPSSLNDWNFDDSNLGFSWWLVDSKIQQQTDEKAWGYSLGTGIKVAYLDKGLKTDHPEIKRRLLIGSQNGINYNNNSSDLGQLGPNPFPDHGHKSLMTLGAEKNNQLWSAGAAPNVSIVPYHCITYWDFETAVNSAKIAGVDVIGASSAQRDFLWLTYLTFFFAFEITWHLNGNGYMQAVENAAKAGIPVVISAANNGESYTNFIPSKSPHVITVGAVQPGFGKDKIVRSVAGDRWPIPLQERLMVSDFSNFGEGLIWGPGNYVKVSARSQPNQIDDYSGTSSAAPFIAGVIALMKSRNPDLSPTCIRQILRDTAQSSGLNVDSPNDNAKFPSSLNVNFVNALAAVKMAIQKTGNCSNRAVTPQMIQEFSGLLLGNSGAKRLLTWKSILPGATAAEKQKTLIRSVSDEFWQQRLVPDSVVKLQGWSDIQAGKQHVSSGEIEVSEGELLCQTSICLSAPVTPKLTAIQTNVGPAAIAEFEMTLLGENLFPDVRGSQARKFSVEFHPVGGGVPQVLNYNQQPDAPALNIWNVNKVIDIGNSGNFIRFKVPANSVPAGDYHLVFDSPLIGKSALDISKGPFSVSATGGSSSFRIQSDNPPPQAIPQEHYVYNQIGNRWVRENSKTLVETNQFAGLYFTLPIREVTIKVGPVELPVVSVLKDLAVFGIPAELSAGIHDLTVEVDGQTLNINQAIEKVSQGLPAYLEAGPPPSGNPGYYNHANLSNVEGQDEARVYLNGTLMGTATSSDYNKQVDLDPHNDQLWKQDQRNQLCFELENRGGGYTYGFDLNDGDTFHDVQGTPGLHVVILPDGQTDTRQGIVYRKCLTLNRFAKPVGSGGQAFWVKVFNLSPGNQFRFQGVSQDRLLVDTPAQIEHSFEMPLYGPWADDPELKTDIRYNRPDGSLHYGQYFSNSIFQWHLQAPENQPGSLGIEVYRGINLVYRYVEGQAGQWGTLDNNLGVYQSEEVYWSFYPNLQPPGGW